MDKLDLIKRWNQLFKDFNNIKHFFNFFGENGTVEVYDRKYRKFLQLEVTFHQLTEETAKYNDFNPATRLFVDHRFWVIEIIDDVKKKYLNAQKIHLQTSPLSDVSILPEIPICVFDGTIENWPEFNILFNTLVHYNYNLSETHKMQYLKSYICGEAARVVSEFPMTEEYYQQAYDKLRKRYGGLRYRGHHYLNLMLKYKEHHFDSERYLNVHENAAYNLRTLNLPNLGECILFYISYNNLDKKTQKKFDAKYSSGTSIPTTKHLFDFVRGCEPEEKKSPEVITLD